MYSSMKNSQPLTDTLFTSVQTGQLQLSAMGKEVGLRQSLVPSLVLLSCWLYVLATTLTKSPEVDVSRSLCTFSSTSSCSSSGITIRLPSRRSSLCNEVYPLIVRPLLVSLLFTSLLPSNPINPIFLTENIFSYLYIYDAIFSETVPFIVNNY